MRHKILAAFCGLAIAASGAVATAQSASAASCTNVEVIYHTLIKDHGNTVGYIDLEYSVACHSARAHIHSIYPAHPYDTHSAHAILHRNSDGAEASKYAKDGSHDATTGWLYDKGVSSYAYGSIDMYPINEDLAHAQTKSY